MVLGLVLAPPAPAQKPAQPKEENVVAGVVVDAKGKPAAGVRVLFWDGTPPAGAPAGAQAQPLVAMTGADGAFSFPPPRADYWLIASGEAGSLQVKAQEKDPAGKHVLKLRPWGRLEGVLRRGAKPLAGETVVCVSAAHGKDGADAPLVQFREQVQTDADGRFAVARVPPGELEVAHLLVRRVGQSRMFSPSHTTPVEIKPGGTTQVAVGGTGRPVIGTFHRDGPLDWARIHATLSTGGDRASRGKREYVLLINPNGSFRAEDIPEGTYVVTLGPMPLYPAGPGGEPPTFTARPARVEVPAIKGGRSDQPLDLGRVNVQVQ
jgi:hypothetical protein